MRDRRLIYPNLAVDLLFDYFYEPYQISMIIVDSSVLEHILVVTALNKLNQERETVFTNFYSLTVSVVVLIARNESTSRQRAHYRTASLSSDLATLCVISGNALLAGPRRKPAIIPLSIRYCEFPDCYSVYKWVSHQLEPCVQLQLSGCPYISSPSLHHPFYFSVFIAVLDHASLCFVSQPICI
jgi:hypothetical protein